MNESFSQASLLAYFGAASAACFCASAKALRHEDGSPVASVQASTEVYRPSCTFTSGSFWQAVNSRGAALISSSAVVRERFMASCPVDGSMPQ
ncbi:hypothetical protein G6F24_018583 [Rhizopus arrhizus]|nr:hypothetical protein G6F24_018583 [Rhizopus arrhizus]